MTFDAERTAGCRQAGGKQAASTATASFRPIPPSNITLRTGQHRIVHEAGCTNHQANKSKLAGTATHEQAQAFGQRSKESISAPVFGARRIVGKVMTQPTDFPICPKKLDAGPARLTQGLAWWYERFAGDAERCELRNTSPQKNVQASGLVPNRFSVRYLQKRKN